MQLAESRFLFVFLDMPELSEISKSSRSNGLRTLLGPDIQRHIHMVAESTVLAPAGNIHKSNSLGFHRLSHIYGHFPSNRPSEWSEFIDLLVQLFLAFLFLVNVSEWTSHIPSTFCSSRFRHAQRR
jgi:hypothetical protein